MRQVVIENPVLNSPFSEPFLLHENTSTGKLTKDILVKGKYPSLTLPVDGERTNLSVNGKGTISHRTRGDKVHSQKHPIRW